MKRTVSFCLAMVAMAAALSSCMKTGPDNISALVTSDGSAAGVVVTYLGQIDKSSVSDNTYVVDGREITKVFASDVNPFDKDRAEGKYTYVVVLLKDSESSIEDGKIEIVKSNPDVSIRQARDIKDAKGKKVPAWKKDYKATEYFPIM